ncbi:MAG: 2Fe-2S iron-sulfur cluster binding domain-containing protein [Kiritimatiellae bacterium]|nr:2Fe-2S iron-sulfur cluster binding domain-containing protein [Kiritimatiellia bacterium]
MIYLQAVAVLGVTSGVLTILLLLADRFIANYGPCRVRVNEEDPFVVEGGGKLLEVLYQRRIFIPSACGGQGTCGFCKVTVPKGGGPVLPTELPYLSRDELASGVRLACQVKVREDVEVRVRPDYLNIREYTARVQAARLVTPDTRELILKLTQPSSIEFRPGQYVQVNVPGRPEPTFRAYSISSPPSARQAIELLVRLIPGGVGSAYLHRVRVNDTVTFTGPYGEFVLDQDPGCELVCVGGGCGLAPMRSIIRHIRETAPARPCRLFFGARTKDDAMYLDEFRQLAREMTGLQVHYALSEPKRGSDWPGETGFIHESVARHLDAGVERQAFLCGPPPMIEATLQVLDDKGVSRDRIFFDEF